MKAIVLEEPKHFKAVDLEEAAGPGAGEALVAVHRVGICGTDLSGYLGKFPFYSYPRIPGHELGVEILEVGDGVDHIKAGDRCSVEPYINTPESFASRRGRGNCYDNLQVLGVHIDGGMRERFVVPARKLHPSRGGLKMEQLALIETLAIGCHTVDRAAPTADDTVTFKGDDSEEEALKAINQGELPTIVIDATGNARSMANAMNYVAHTGTLVYVGISSTKSCPRTAGSTPKN